MAKHLHRQLKLDGAKAALLRELTDADLPGPAGPGRRDQGAAHPPGRPRPLDEAISNAGGVPFEELDEGLMLRRLPGVFCAGEMLDWEAPTGGYLLTACFASGRAAAEGMLRWLRANVPANAPRAERCAAGRTVCYIFITIRPSMRPARACRRRSG